MNRYQQEVAEMDRRRRITIRALSFLGATSLAVLALWSAGLPPTEWLGSLQSWWTRGEASQLQVRQAVAGAPTQAEKDAAPTLKSRDTASLGTDSSLSAAPLPLYLMATTPGRSKNEGIALIGTSVENPQTYGSGATLANGAVLTEVHEDHVLLTRGNASAKLYLYQRDPRAQQRRGSDSMLTVSAQALKPLAVEKVNEGLTDYLRPSPFYDDHGLRGYQVYPGVRSTVFTRLGLQPGDVITSINDVPLNEPSHSIELFMQLMRGVAVVATVERKNMSQRITLDGAVIAADQQSTKEASVAAAPALPSS